MKKVFLAYLFLLLDFELVSQLEYFSLFVPLLGCVCLARGFLEMGAENDRFDTAVPAVMFFGSVRILLFVLQRTHTLPEEKSYFLMIGVGLLVVLLWISYCIFVALREIERENEMMFGGGTMFAGSTAFFVVGVLGLLGKMSVFVQFDMRWVTGGIAIALMYALYRMNSAYTAFEKTM